MRWQLMDYEPQYLRREYTIKMRKIRKQAVADLKLEHMAKKQASAALAAAEKEITKEEEEEQTKLEKQIFEVNNSEYPTWRRVTKTLLLVPMVFVQWIALYIVVGLLFWWEQWIIMEWGDCASDKLDCDSAVGTAALIILFLHFLHFILSLHRITFLI
jgi:hypothetical protein